ncbi:hypothetical protein M758_11G100400 [Ceratodon purpureus]|nr:hypothetical protein M758_11G100400 [Ceratodon purpureus]
MARTKVFVQAKTLTKTINLKNSLEPQKGSRCLPTSRDAMLTAKPKMDVSRKPGVMIFQTYGMNLQTTSKRTEQRLQT